MIIEISEHAFGTHILTRGAKAHGYLERRSAEHDDRATCLGWEPALSFITAAQPETWKDLEKQPGAQVADKFKRRPVQEIGQRGALFLSGEEFLV